ncbi:MAG: hypothetical protein IPL49_17950 [Saprospirales bacterium]|nr:hypothetical protein [Saprospirales bacterium]
MTTSSLNIENAYAFPTVDGTNGQVLTTDGSVAVPWFTPTDTDNQTKLGLSGTTLSITNGNSVDLATIDTDTDNQTLGLSGATLQHHRWQQRGPFRDQYRYGQSNPRPLRQHAQHFRR